MKSQLSAEEAGAFFDFPEAPALHSSVQYCLIGSFGHGLLREANNIGNSAYLKPLTDGLKSLIHRVPMVGPNLSRLIDPQTIDLFNRALNPLLPEQRAKWESDALQRLSAECVNQITLGYLQEHLQGFRNQWQQKEIDDNAAKYIAPEVIDMYRNFLTHFIDTKRVDAAISFAQASGLRTGIEAVHSKISSFEADDPCRLEYESKNANLGNGMVGRFASKFANSLQDPSMNYMQNLQRRADSHTAAVDQEYLEALAVTAYPKR